MNALESRVAELASRIQALEDELAIHRLIVRYGFGVDRGDADAAAAVFAEDGIYDVDGALYMQGRGDVRAMVNGPRHQAMVGHCAHQIGPAVVEVDGDRATATGYSRVYLQTVAGTHVYRVSCNRWSFVRRDVGWFIAHRTTRMLGHAEALVSLPGGPLIQR